MPRSPASDDPRGWREAATLAATNDAIERGYGGRVTPDKRVFGQCPSMYSGFELDFLHVIQEEGVRSIGDFVDVFLSGMGRTLFLLGRDDHAFGIVHDPDRRTAKYPRGKFKLFDSNQGIASFTDLRLFQQFVTTYFKSYGSQTSMTNMARAFIGQHDGGTFEIYSAVIPYYADQISPMKRRTRG